MCLSLIFHIGTQKVLFLIVIVIYNIFGVNAVAISSNEKSRSTLSQLLQDDLELFMQLGSDSINQQHKLEENLISSRVTVENGSLSHTILLDSLPNKKAQEDSEVATKILKSSLYIYNTKCAPKRITTECQQILANITIPETSNLGTQCLKIINGRRDGHHAFRRLLPRKYKDGIYEVYTEYQQSPAIRVSRTIVDHNHCEIPCEGNFKDNRNNLALVQWAQFIEHDLSKPVVSSMNTGAPIECCYKGSYRLQPRYHHPACYPMLDRTSISLFSKETCLNYVRSAVVIGTTCTFGDVEKLNQATASLDLSQLYGFTGEAQMHMRRYKNGYLKATKALNLHQDLLPPVSGAKDLFCAFKLDNSSACFMAGDSRVNSNPLTIIIYTLFLRNHNQIADLVHLKYPHLDDEQLYSVAREVNAAIYRQVIAKEWLPIILGNKISMNLRKPIGFAKNESPLDTMISNEFAVAAIRFYYSMMTNAINGTNSYKSILLGEQIYKPSVIQSTTLDEILQSILLQKAMRVDTHYADAFKLDTESDEPPTRLDTLAFDIQRGRDHGLQGYVRYLEVCENTRITNWQDLEKFIASKDLNRIKTVYRKFDDIDLIVGGISELPIDGSIVGPTFSCILAEQFAALFEAADKTIFNHDETKEMLKLMDIKTITAFDIVCANSDLEYAPVNIFQLPSQRNPLKSCANRRLMPEGRM